MNISSEVRGRHTVGDKTCGCRPSGLRHIFILSAMYCLLLFYSRKIQKNYAHKRQVFWLVLSTPSRLPIHRTVASLTRRLPYMNASNNKWARTHSSGYCNRVSRFSLSLFSPTEID